jgi:serine/threonine protein kinase
LHGAPAAAAHDGRSRHRRLESLFSACLDLPEAQRSAFLDSSAAAIRRCGRGSRFVATMPFRRAPTVIGAYTLRAKLGEGGFGEVYEAEQSAPVRRRVAIKILKAGMDSRAVLARFEAERQALALMDHPGIAKVYDAGVTDAGRSYFVMERVAGVSITEACDAGRLPLRERLTLFVAVCRAVQHAHTKGVIHRDLKPSNILVTTVDGAPHPKVIDFGIAKATSASLAASGTPDEGAPRTLQGEILGTPEYMSGQAGSRGIDVDAAPDVYSLDVVLFRLTGRVPFPSERLRGGDFAAIQRILLEEEPPKPSDAAPSAARELRGDLDWIVLRALEKDRGRRYPSAAALADDIERHLRHEPVSPAD